MYYSGKEIVEIAVRIEENGYAFYIAAAEMIREPNEIKNLFLDLAEQETIIPHPSRKYLKNSNPRIMNRLKRIFQPTSGILPTNIYSESRKPASLLQKH